MKGRLSSPLPREVLISRTIHRNNACDRLAPRKHFSTSNSHRTNISTRQSIKHDSAAVLPRGSHGGKRLHHCSAALPSRFREASGNRTSPHPTPRHPTPAYLSPRFIFRAASHNGVHTASKQQRTPRFRIIIIISSSSMLLQPKRPGYFAFRFPSSAWMRGSSSQWYLRVVPHIIHTTKEGVTSLVLST